MANKNRKVNTYSEDEIKELFQKSQDGVLVYLDPLEGVVKSEPDSISSVSERFTSIFPKGIKNKAKAKISKSKTKTLSISNKYPSEKSSTIAKISVFALMLFGLYLSLVSNRDHRPIYVFVGILIAIWSLFVLILLFIKDRRSSNGGSEEDLNETLKNLSLSQLDEIDRILLLLVAVSTIIVLILFALAYNLDLNKRILMYSAIVIGIISITAMILFRLNDLNENPQKYKYLTEKEQKELLMLKEKNIHNERRSILEVKHFMKSYFILQHVFFMILYIMAISILMGEPLIPNSDSNTDQFGIQFNISMIVISLTGVLGILQSRREHNVRDGDLDKTAVIRFISYIFLPLLAMVVYPTTNMIIEAKINEGGAYAIAEISNSEYFNGVYNAILQSKYMQFSMAFIIISALTIIIGKARGDSGSMIMVAGAMGMAGIPMIIAVMAFGGQVPPPPVFYELFGDGFGNLVFAIAYTTVVSLLLALVGIFYSFVPSSGEGSL